MSNNSNKLRESEEKRDELIKEMMTQKYNYIEITDKDKKANELYHSKVETNFKFQDDFYLWLIDKVSDVSEFDKLMDPEFFDTDGE